MQRDHFKKRPFYERRTRKFFRHPGEDAGGTAGGGGAPAPDAAAIAAQKVADEAKIAAAKAAGASHVEVSDGLKVLDTKAYGLIKDEARDKGRKEVTAELDAEARKLGYGTHAELLAAVPTLKARDKAATDLEKARVDLETKNNIGETERARLAGVVEQKGREIKVRDSLLRMGFVDTEYGVDLAEKHIATLSSEDAKKFDPKAFFEGIKASRPALFDVKVVVPATTGAGGTAPPAPNPGEAAKADATAGKVDALTMTPEQLRAYETQMFGRPISN